MKTTYNKLIGLLTAATISLTLSSCGGGGSGGGSSSSSSGSNSGSTQTTVMAPPISTGDQIRITVTRDGYSTSENLTIISNTRLRYNNYGGTAAYTYKRSGSSATFSYTTAGIYQSSGSASSTIYKTIKTIYKLTFTSSTTAKINSLTYETAIGGTVTERKTATSGNATFTIL
ncbi:MAG: hypothetical protein IJ503_04170 [Akkermansia sp.]|nr:hypothetical protein [Akkermansia sp.]